MGVITTIGIRREDKHVTERRVPLTPDAVRELQHRGDLRFIVESSDSRIHRDEEYVAASADIADELPPVDFVLGLKEVPLERLQPGKPHLFFSHTIKGQPYNMPLLQKLLDEKCTLLDYERVTKPNGQRLIYFGVHAGQAGMINTLWSFGQRLKAKGIETPFADLRQAKTYDSLDDAKAAIRATGRKLRTSPLPKVLQPLTCAITGTGNVARGAQEVFDELDPIRITPDKFLEAARNRWLKPEGIYKIVFRVKDLVEPLDNNNLFHLQDYFDHPEKYRSRFQHHLPHLSMLLNGIYWDPSFPRVVTLQDVRRIFSNGREPKLTVIGDVTCDPHGGIECTLRATMPDNPVYVFNPDTGNEVDGFEGPGLQMMPVDILPTELARESSATFSDMLKEWIPQVTSADYSAPFGKIDLPNAFRQATIVYNGELTPDYRYLNKYVKALDDHAASVADHS